MAKLTEQRKAFVDEHIKLRCKNATQAAINAGYSPKTAQSQASQMLMDSNVSAYLAERQSLMSEDLRREFLFDALAARKVMYSILQNEFAADKDRIAVARDFLDRAGFKPSEKVEHSGEVSNPFAGLTTEELRRLAGEATDDG